MKEIDFEEHKKIELEILKYFADYCEQHELKYYLAYGTLIGAVRHKGFIPWDDDIDVMMPRDDYELLLKSFNNECFDNNYYLVSPFDSISKHAITKIIDNRTIKIEPNLEFENGYLGVDIDIFPIDGQPEDDRKFIKYYNKLMRIYKKLLYAQMSEKGGTSKRKILLPIIKKTIGSRNTLLKKSEKILHKYSCEYSNFVGVVACLYNGPLNRYKKEWFEDYVMLEFEGCYFRAPLKYDKILSKLYGDYMKLPPIEQQQTHHENKIYWK